MGDSKFNVRVYGIYIDKDRRVLVSDEFFKNKFITKFPGGGLEFGEGTIDCLKREMLEETGCNFEILSHLYTTDFFVESAFHPDRQIISIYYLMTPNEELTIKISEKKFDFEKVIDGAQSFRLVKFEDLKPETFTFPIDQHVAGMLMAK